MDTVPNPVINEQIVYAAQVALAHFSPKTKEHVAVLLRLWARRSEMTWEDIDEVGERMFPKTLPMMGCPAWCETEHERYRYSEIEDLCEHDRDLLVERDENGAVKVQVYLVQVDNLGERRRSPAGVMVQADEPLTPDQAIHLIGAVSEGLRIIA